MLTAEGTETADSGKRGLVISSTDQQLAELILSNERREKLRPQMGVTLPLLEVAGVTVNTRTPDAHTMYLKGQHVSGLCLVADATVNITWRPIGTLAAPLHSDSPIIHSDLSRQSAASWEEPARLRLSTHTSHHEPCLLFVDVGITNRLAPLAV